MSAKFNLGALRLRVRVWLRRRALDLALAAGSPIDSPELASRAAQLARQRTRDGLARVILNLIDAAEERTAPRGSDRWALNRDGVLAAAGELMQLTYRLQDREPMPIAAVAQAWLLVFDDESPLCGPASREAAVSAVELVLSAAEDRSGAPSGLPALTFS